MWKTMASTVTRVAKETLMVTTGGTRRQNLTKADTRKKTGPWIRWGNLKCNNIIAFRATVIPDASKQFSGNTSRIWETMVTTITRVRKESLRVTTGYTRRHNEPWWWTEHVQNKIRDKKMTFNELLRCTDGDGQLILRKKYKKPR